jgi:hypothetical protein
MQGICIDIKSLLLKGGHTMSLFDASSIEVKLYYIFRKKDNSTILTVLSDEKAEKMLADDEKKKEVEVLITQWSVMSWDEQNASVKYAYDKVNEITGEKIFDHVAYRDAIIKSCLKGWDIEINGQPAPLTPENINRLPGEVVMAIYSKYEQTLSYTEAELKN